MWVCGKRASYLGRGLRAREVWTRPQEWWRAVSSRLNILGVSWGTWAGRNLGNSGSRAGRWGWGSGRGYLRRPECSAGWKCTGKDPDWRWDLLWRYHYNPRGKMLKWMEAGKVGKEKGEGWRNLKMTNQKGSRDWLEGGLREEMLRKCPWNLGWWWCHLSREEAQGGPGQEGLQGKSLGPGDHPTGTRGCDCTKEGSEEAASPAVASWPTGAGTSPLWAVLPPDMGHYVGTEKVVQSCQGPAFLGTGYADAAKGRRYQRLLPGDAAEENKKEWIRERKKKELKGWMEEERKEGKRNSGIVS